MRQVAHVEFTGGTNTVRRPAARHFSGMILPWLALAFCLDIELAWMIRPALGISITWMTPAR